MSSPCSGQRGRGPGGGRRPPSCLLPPAAPDLHDPTGVFMSCAALLLSFCGVIKRHKSVAVWGFSFCFVFVKNVRGMKNRRWTFEPKFNKTIGHIFALKCNLKVPV